MIARMLILLSGPDARHQVEELAASMARLVSSVAVEDLENGDYDRILDAVVEADTVICWPAGTEG